MLGLISFNRSSKAVNVLTILRDGQGTEMQSRITFLSVG